MNVRHRIKPIFLLIAVFVLAGCSTMSVKLGWVGNAFPGHSEASFARFRGEELYSIHLESGEELVLQYSIELEEGILGLRVQDGNDDVLWIERFEGTAADEVRISAEEEGWYALVVQGEDAKGMFDLTWSVD